ncbi:hypothetical protein [Cutibacterium granulosum]|nr:hypothetical protein [Cutibacterium granulosum]MDU4678359.1 hypothetical protein [Cutibacterium granulosum]MDU7727278.1 hypothetical protein [Cutibacterium granulosum]
MRTGLLVRMCHLLVMVGMFILAFAPVLPGVLPVPITVVRNGAASII